jgi:hypothetical protein
MDFKEPSTEGMCSTNNLQRSPTQFPSFLQARYAWIGDSTHLIDRSAQARLTEPLPRQYTGD